MLNRDILYLVLEELQDDKKALCSSLSVNKTWCEIIIRILWRNPWKYTTSGYKIFSLFIVIVSHLTEKSRNNLKIQGVDLPSVSSQKPLFNYISLCRHLNLNGIDKILNTVKYHYSSSALTILKNEIYNLFINENTKFTHLYLPQRFDYQIHFISGAKQCFSEMEFLSCYTLANDNILAGLADICNSIKKLELFIEPRRNNDGISKLINSSKKLIEVRLLTDPLLDIPDLEESYNEILENSLMKHAHTLQYFKSTELPTTKILSSLVNLKRLELSVNFLDVKLNNLGNISLPNLRILKSENFQIKVLRNLIVNTNGSLIKISIDDAANNEVENNKNIIQAIYQNCPNLMYLKLLIKNENILELEKLLTNCQYLSGFYFLNESACDFDKLFGVLTLSSSKSLFKFKFNNIRPYEPFNLDSLKLFFDNWKGRHPMLLQLDSHGNGYLTNLILKYKSDGVIKKFDDVYKNYIFEDFECNISIIKNEIFNLLINENTKFTHLYLPQRFDYQIYRIPGAKQCFSDIVFLSCYTRINDKILIGLAEVCQSIKELELFIETEKNNYGVIKLINASKTLIDVRLITNYVIGYDFFINYSNIDVRFHTILENSLMKYHANTIQYFKMTTPPTTEILSSLVNLKELELSVNNQNIKLNNLENIFLPSLQILKSNVVRVQVLRNLFANTNGSLIKISINDIPHSEIDNKSIVQAIYQYCPNLKYLKLMFRNESILELEQLLINCQYLNGLYFFAIETFDWDELFRMLTISSPTNLIKFKFNDVLSHEKIMPESIKLFLDNWRGRNPILLQFDPYGCADLIDLIEEYKKEEIIRKFDNLHGNFHFGDFEW
ncbi:hypothetical protein RclHR1_00060013 [Rhizophagus clarus]|uniref:F-box domain-containing protein n=1 Tax=Rhizophagus clarus TaxID=94130 RepID=A0A2Z6S6Z0_9GLOM|nr:hypothetical protein RclHR1_00060013 [Rhizophagus clarus]GES74584.1 hypothetical protein GLOIN_2v1877952 [Rhizophagus clarus]